MPRSDPVARSPRSLAPLLLPGVLRSPNHLAANHLTCLHVPDSAFTYPGRAARRAPPERSGATGPPRATARGGPGDNVPRLKLERETGIEPATNSLEGCDSTTELLPPTRSLTSTTRATAGKPAILRATSSTASAGASANFPIASRPRRSGLQARRNAFDRLANDLSSDQLACQPQPASRAKRFGGRRLVARGGFEPPKPLGRQIYSLLRLTASLPRRYPPADAPGLTFVVLDICCQDLRARDSCRPASRRLVIGSRSFGSRFRRERGAGEGI